MPHLPPVEVNGVIMDPGHRDGEDLPIAAIASSAIASSANISSSVTIKIPLSEAKRHGATLFKREATRVETFPEEENGHYPSEERAAVGAVAEIAANSHRPEYPEENEHDDEGQPAQYKVQPFSAGDNLQIYLVEIYGSNGSDVFEFRPKNGECSVKVYYAFDWEMDEVREMMEARRWPRPDLERHKQASGNGGSGHSHPGHSHPDQPSDRGRSSQERPHSGGIFHAFCEWLKAFPKYVSMPGM